MAILVKQSKKNLIGHSWAPPTYTGDSFPSLDNSSMHIMYKSRKIYHSCIMTARKLDSKRAMKSR